MAIELTMKFETEAQLRAWLDTRNETETPASDETQANEPARAAEAHSPVVAQTETETETETADEPTRDSKDADGMGYDESVHSDPPSFTADGLWRAKRGKAEEAKAARAAFKAAGGDVEPPAVMPGADAPAEPVAAPTAMPGMDAPAPVTFAAVMAKAAEALNEGKVDSEKLCNFYAETAGLDANSLTLAKDATDVFSVNETARAALMRKLESL